MLPIFWRRQARYSRHITVVSAILAMSIALSLSGCGSTVNEVKVKEFKLALVNSSEPGLVGVFRKLVDDYNNEAGLRALTFVDSAEQANSAVIVTKGLQKRDGKVGWGQPLAEIDEQRLVDDLNGIKINRTTRHFMRVEFDEEYFRQRMESTEESAMYDLKKLFFHEVGHGLEMGHEPADKENLMYPDISGSKNFADYFNRVRAYFN